MAKTTWTNYRKDKTKLLEQGVWSCLTCMETKPVSEFYQNPTKSWPSSHCRPCFNKKQREAGKPAQLRYLYNISPGEYADMLIDQGYRCGICKRHYEEFDKMLSVDHDHKCCAGKRSCGKCVRGLLCGSCNNLLGKIQDDVERLRSAISYLDKE